MSEQIKRLGDLQIDEDMEFEKKNWRVERISWVLLGLFILAGLAGLFGTGPLSYRTAGNRADDLWIEYPRISRNDSPEELRVHLGSGAGAGSQVRLALDRRYVESFQIEDIEPEPLAVEARKDELIYYFQRQGPEETTVTFHLKA